MAMGMEHKISVVIPTFNRKDALVRAIDSALVQSLPPWEIIVVDDHSDFSTEAFLGSYFGDSISVVTNSVNLGGAESRNIGVQCARGDYIAFLDSDDYWDPRKLELQMAVFKTHPDAEVIYCDMWVVEREKNPRRSGKELFDKNLWDRLIDGWTAPNTSTLLFRKAAFYKLGGFDALLTSCQDHDLWMRIARSKVVVAFSPEPLSYLTVGTANRVTYDCSLRFLGMQRFLAKWEEELVNSRGKQHAKWFKKNYELKVAYPVFTKLARNGRVGKTITVYLQYLALNPSFYKHLIMASIRKIVRYRFRREF